MKKITACILALGILSQTSHIFAQDGSDTDIHAFESANSTQITEESAFTTVKIPIPDNIEKSEVWSMHASYKDSGEIITLSSAYDGYIWATVPSEKKDMTIEAVDPNEKDFADIEKDSEYYDIKWLSRTNVIRGNEKGEAEPLRNVTRAEAVTMVMRFLGLEEISFHHTDKLYAEYENLPTFDDVQKDDWFFHYVTYAKKCGIVDGDSESTFSPNRAITREEFVVMVANALKYANLKCTPIAAGADDADKISDWAKEAFEIIGAGCVYDYSDNEKEPENPYCFVNPNYTATRIYAAKLLNNVQGICQIYPSETAIKYGFDKEMPIIDGSTSTYPFTQAVYGSLFSNGMTHKQRPEKHSKTHTSYERLINGDVDMLFSSHHPANDIVALAAEKGVEFELIPIAYDAMIFFTNSDNPATNLTKEQISNIYVNNAYKNWNEIGGSDALLYPYCRNNDSGSHAQMEKHFLNGGDIHPDIKTETSYTMTNILTDVMAAKTDSPLGYGLGYSIYYFFNNMDFIFNTKTELKLLAIDGIMPNDETISNGTYPLSNNTYIVLRKDTPKDSPARKMVEFMQSEQGQNCVESAGFGKLIK